MGSSVPNMTATSRRSSPRWPTRSSTTSSARPTVPCGGVEAVRRRYQDFLTATVHERDIPIRRLYGKDFVFDEHAWHGRLTGRAFEIDGHGRWISYRVLWLLEVRDGRIVRQTVWNDISAIRRQLE